MFEQSGSVPGAVLGSMVLIQIFILVLWSRPGKKSFAWRLNQLLALLLAGTDEGRRRRVKSSARRWRTQLRPIYDQGYQAAAETISPSVHVARGQDLVRDTLAALKAERADGGAKVPAREDPVVVFAYGLGAWPPGAD